ncbi:MAG: tRNA pseudouridine(38-40) synthase TruA [Vulcanimicrobiota bacterium]
MARYRLTVAYQGDAFAGFQRQPEGGPESVQGTLERALSSLMAEPVQLKAAGRTDAGVHATGQVIAFDSQRDRPPEVVVRGANAILPETIRVLHAELADPDFHPRYDALSRIYHYHVLSQSHDLFWSQRAWCLPDPLEQRAMQAAAGQLLGEHDFSTYSSRAPADQSRIRTLTALDVSRSEWAGPAPFDLPLITFRLEANAFVRRMVRLLVAALVEVGRGRWAVQEPARRLALRDPAQAPPPAPPGGLYLVKVNYPSGVNSPP